VELKLQQVEETVQDILAAEDNVAAWSTWMASTPIGLKSTEETLSFSSMSTDATSASFDSCPGDEDGWQTDDGF
jgi:hypothetical protein